MAIAYPQPPLVSIVETTSSLCLLRIVAGVCIAILLEQVAGRCTPGKNLLWFVQGSLVNDSRLSRILQLSDTNIHD